MLYWLAGFLLSLVNLWWGIWLIQRSRHLTPRIGLPSIITGLSLDLGTWPLAIVAVATALIPFRGHFTDLLPLLILTAPVTWMLCWTRGLERYADLQIGNRNFTTPEPMLSALPYGILLLGPVALRPNGGATEILSACASLFPPYILTCALIFRKTYPDIPLTLKIYTSQSLRHGVGFLAICLLTWLAFSFGPPVVREPAFFPVAFIPILALGTATADTGLAHHLENARRNAIPLVESPMLEGVPRTSVQAQKQPVGAGRSSDDS